MRVKEAPAQALRAVFGGIGSLLSVSDKIRNKPATPETAASTETVAAVTPETTAVPDVAAAPQTTAVPEDEAAPETTVTPETTITPEDLPGPETTITPEASAELPLANYDELSIASLRARLRNLSVDQLTQLIGYEQAHANRAEVITMFERRITKINLGLTQALPKVTE
jgi:hypothetical protein